MNLVPNKNFEDFMAVETKEGGEFQNIIADNVEGIKYGELVYCFGDKQREVLFSMFDESNKFSWKEVDGVTLILPHTARAKMRGEYERCN